MSAVLISTDVMLQLRNYRHKIYESAGLTATVTFTGVVCTEVAGMPSVITEIWLLKIARCSCGELRDGMAVTQSPHH